ncbi:pyrimidine (deoxy)nucleoside triphosphate diphosphatase [Acerihabitans arboris]|uniref:pyrimidine (deoxy)nucleoside triphosphate diphosphatase n=1 Tax=Acerihabitans arboris TaxID=2691583 RepID=UPI0015B76FA5|nr:pyrimidine (deoxy)nucleoside triphosphate diphosphatase [Acerihabitans arboris]
MPPIEVVAAVIEHEGRILLARRDGRRDQAGLWEFPGGKMEAGESQTQALRRELREELSIDARVGAYIASEYISLPDRRMMLHAWHVPAFGGKIELHCHSEIAWVTPATAVTYALAPADVPILQAFMRLK